MLKKAQIGRKCSDKLEYPLPHTAVAATVYPNAMIVRRLVPPPPMPMAQAVPRRAPSLSAPWPVSLAAAWLTLVLSVWPTATRAADEPVDVPITRGKIDLSGLKPSLAPAPPPGTTTTAPPASPGGAATAPATAATANTRPKPRTVADYVAEAKAKAATEVAAKNTPPAAETPAAPTTPTTPVAEKPAPKATVGHTAPTAKATETPPAKAMETAPVKAAGKPPAMVPAKAPAKAADDGLDKVAVRLVEAMSRAAAKQDKREGTHTQSKTPPEPSHAKAGKTAHSHDAHWSYDGDTGPAHWAKLKPEFNACAIGKRQSPIPIDEAATLQGPADPIGFDYHPSEGSVVHNGHTIQVDLAPTNRITVRGGTYELLQFHFHHPSEEQVNGKRYAMVAHLVHKNAEGQLAVVAVLLTPGEPNPAVDTVWKHMPLDVGDRVKLPTGALNLPDLLPQDQRYYQFMGSLTTPPCTEGVLWMVLKTPVTLSPAQIRLFGQLFPNNARPVQEVNGRAVREGL